MGPKGNFLCAKKFYPSTGCFKNKKKVRKKSYQARLVFGSTFGVWWGLGFCRLAWSCAWWNPRSAGGGIALGGGVQLLSVSGGCFQKSTINSQSLTFGCYPVQKVLKILVVSKTRRKKSSKNKKEKKKFGKKKLPKFDPFQRKPWIFLSQDFCFQNKIEKKKFGHLH